MGLCSTSVTYDASFVFFTFSCKNAVANSKYNSVYVYTYLVHCFVTQEQKNWFGEFYLELYARTYQAEVQHSTYYAVLGDGQTTI